MGSNLRFASSATAKSARKTGIFRFSAAQVEWLSRNYGWLTLVFGLLILFIHTLDSVYTTSHPAGFHPLYYLEIVTILVLLFIVSFLFYRLFASIEEKKRAIHLLELKNRLHLLLSMAQDADELSRLMARELCALLPETDLQIWLHEERTSRHLRAHSRNGEFSIESQDVCERTESLPCRGCHSAEELNPQSLKACQHETGQSPAEPASAPEFCLSLMENGLVLGTIRLRRQNGQALSAWQIQAVNALRPEMTQSIARLLARRAQEEALLTERIRTMQLDIARDLHDTVGQNVGYLRMKLDALVDNPPQTLPEWQEEARQMAGVANESYDLVRGTLNILQSDDSADMVFMFSRYARQVGQRSGFRVEFSSQGKPKTLSPSQMRHVFYIFREALSNIEKHANAHKASIQVVWDENNLNLRIADDGEGYDPNRTMKLDVHYGLKFMRERAELLSGTLGIQSIVGAGTTVDFLMPL